MQPKVTGDIKQSSQQQEIPNDIKDVVGLNEFKKKYGIFYYTPTRDNAFKEVIIYSCESIQKSFLRSMLKIEFPKKDFEIRSAKILQDHVSSRSENGSAVVKQVRSITPNLIDKQSITADKQPNISVDSLFCVNVADSSIKSAETELRIFIEMQVREQRYIIARLFNYGSTILLELQKTGNNSQVGGFACCMWANQDGLTVGCETKPSSTGCDSGISLPVNLTARGIYLDKLKNKSSQGKLLSKDDIDKLRNELKARVMKHFGVERLEGTQIEVYEWLEFIAFAHLMTDDDVNALSTQQVKEAYKIMEVTEHVKDCFKDQFGEIWGDLGLKQEIEAKDKKLNDQQVQLEMLKQMVAKQNPQLLEEYNKQLEQRDAASQEQKEPVKPTEKDSPEKKK